MSIFTNKEMEDMSFGSNVTNAHPALRMFLSHATSEFAKINKEDGLVVDSLVVNHIGLSIEEIIGPSYTRLTKITNVDDANANYGIWAPLDNQLFAGVLLVIVDGVWETDAPTSWGVLITNDGWGYAFSRLQPINLENPLNPYELLTSVIPEDVFSNITYMACEHKNQRIITRYECIRPELSDTPISDIGKCYRTYSSAKAL